MVAYIRHKKYRGTNWSLWVWPEKWNHELWCSILKEVESQHPARHPQTTEIRRPDTNEVLFLKVFHRFSFPATLKDLCRASKALRALKTGTMLSASGFHVPLAVAAGEQRNHRVLQRSFLLTFPVPGSPLPLLLRDRYGAGKANVPWSEKRNALGCLAREIRRLHDLGFVHGDLVPSNIFVSNVGDQERRFFFLDNDRTRRYPRWFPQSLWKRNLVQLNRFPLAGISLQDRMRFFHFYTGRKECSQHDRRLVRWLEKKTRQRRRECDRVDVSGSFRRLMRWDTAS